MRKLLYVMFLVGILCPLQGLAETRKPIKITFVNPSLVGSVFWDTTTAIMQAAAEDLNIALKVVYASTPDGINRFKHIDLVRQEATSADPPDFLITHFRKGMGRYLLETIEAAQLKTFTFNTNVAEAENDKVLAPRQKYKYWVGHMYPDDVQAGYDMMEYLILDAQDKGMGDQDGKVGIIGLSGNHHSVAAINRNTGLKKAVEDHQQALHQIFFARWSPKVANDMTKRGLARFPQTDIVWAANDGMILGALDTIEQQNRAIVTGGMDWTPAALQAVQKGDLTVTFGGHFMEAAWAMVMLHDYYYGKDFFDPKEPKIRSFLRAIDRRNVDDYLKYFGDREWSKIDFTQFSKVHNPDLKTYDFTLKALLNQMQNNVGRNP